MPEGLVRNELGMFRIDFSILSSYMPEDLPAIVTST